MESQLLFLNGAIVLFIGLLVGFPYGRAINSEKPEKKIEAWRMAHSSISAGGVALLGIGAVFAHLQSSTIIHVVVAMMWIVSGYGFAGGAFFAALWGKRGLHFENTPKGGIVFGLYFVGIVTSLIAGALFIIITAKF